MKNNYKLKVNSGGGVKSLKLKRISLIIAGIFCYALLVTSGTYAYLEMKKNTSVAGSAKCNGINYQGQEINASNLSSTTNYLEGAKSTITLSQSEDCKIYSYVNIYLHTNDNITAPIESVKALKYKVFQRNNQISEGLITSIGDKRIATVPLEKADVSYDIYLYIDSNDSNGEFDGTSYYGYIYASSFQNSMIDSFTVRDLSYNTNDAIAYGASWNKNDGIVTTDGVDDYIDAGLANYDFKSSVTLISRFKWLKDNESENVVIADYEYAGMGLSFLSDGYPFFEVYSNEKNCYLMARFDKSINFNEWYTAVGTYDGKVIKLYLNGDLVASTDVVGTIKTSTVPFHIASNPTPSGELSTPSNLSYSDILIYNKTLSEEEIKAVFSSDIDNNKVNRDGLLVYYNFK